MGTVTHIGDWKFQHKREGCFVDPKGCAHRHLELDDRGDVVKCVDCQVQISAFWALRNLIAEYDRSVEKLRSEKESLARERHADLHLLAAKKVEKVWRSRTMVPACPHCKAGILAEDGLGATQIGKEFEIRRRIAAADCGSSNKED